MKRLAALMAVAVFFLSASPVKAQTKESDDVRLDDPVYVAKVFVTLTFVADAFDELKKTGLIWDDFLKSVEDSVKLIRKNDKAKLLGTKPQQLLAEEVYSQEVSEDAKIHVIATLLSYEDDIKVFYVFVLNLVKKGMCMITAVHELTKEEIVELYQMLQKEK
ncbi:MAG: hypothetical protein ABIM32_00555 [candidate division WOR-3 bacterium]